MVVQVFYFGTVDAVFMPPKCAAWGSTGAACARGGGIDRGVWRMMYVHSVKFCPTVESGRLALTYIVIASMMRQVVVEAGA